MLYFKNGGITRMFRFTWENFSNILKIENQEESHRLYIIAHKRNESALRYYKFCDGHYNIEVLS